ncbi:histidine kinase [Salipaludibacillus neizhouensis]|uniref:Oxygen sensor histidine kinase NreB n=1 Tax=Salipaludibacillus neizhouensis TaxID=885475 RepID=A0A3A9KAF4_9BACI|nr:GAF domain-containing sensor histidine kinase [Salipaludibacillus neizhouensis]RKL67431.1 histidine kinase [Salipaludibacillus neizhouensis]
MERNEELFLIKSIAEMLNKETNMEVMLQQVLKRILELTNLKTGWIFLFDEEKEYQLAAHAYLPEALELKGRKYMCEGSCRCIHRGLTGNLKKATNMIDCERIERSIKEKRGNTEGIKLHASVPIKLGEVMFGLLNVASPGKLNFDDDELHILESIAYQIGTACERIRLSEQERSMLVLEERNRLARDLHDSVNQHLFSIMYTARGTKSISENQTITNSLDEIYYSSKDALAEMKDLIWQLSSDHIKEGLKIRLVNYCKTLDLSVSYECLENKIPDYLETAFWKIGREALNNINKHAESSKVIIHVGKIESFFTLKIEDNGCGFNMNEVSNSGFGLTSMRERAKLINGNCLVTSEPNKGTVVYVKVPIRKERKEYNESIN